MSLRITIQNPYATTIRLGAGPPPPRPRASSVGVPIRVLSSVVAIVMRPASPHSPGPFYLRNFGSQDFVLTIDAPASYQDHDRGKEKVEDCQPPDVPDERKTHNGRKEGNNETGWAVAGHFDRFIRRL